MNQLSPKQVWLDWCKSLKMCIFCVFKPKKWFALITHCPTNRIWKWYKKEILPLYELLVSLRSCFYWRTPPLRLPGLERKTPTTSGVWLLVGCWLVVGLLLVLQLALTVTFTASCPFFQQTISILTVLTFLLLPVLPILISLVSQSKWSPFSKSPRSQSDPQRCSCTGRCPPGTGAPRLHEQSRLLPSQLLTTHWHACGMWMSLPALLSRLVLLLWSLYLSAEFHNKSKVRNSVWKKYSRAIS